MLGHQILFNAKSKPPKIRSLHTYLCILWTYWCVANFRFSTFWSLHGKKNLAALLHFSRKKSCLLLPFHRGFRMPKISVCIDLFVDFLYVLCNILLYNSLIFIPFFPLQIWFRSKTTKRDQSESGFTMHCHRIFLLPRLSHYSWYCWIQQHGKSHKLQAMVSGTLIARTTIYFACHDYPQLFTQFLCLLSGGSYL